MKKFLAGAVIGAIVAGSVPVIAQTTAGGRILTHWEVRDGGRLICYDPVMNTRFREITCE